MTNRFGVVLHPESLLLHLAIAHIDLRQFDNAWRYIGEAMTTTAATKERWSKAEVDRIAGGRHLR